MSEILKKSYLLLYFLFIVVAFFSCREKATNRALNTNIEVNPRLKPVPFEVSEERERSRCKVVNTSLAVQNFDTLLFCDCIKRGKVLSLAMHNCVGIYHQVLSVEISDSVFYSEFNLFNRLNRGDLNVRPVKQKLVLRELTSEVNDTLSGYFNFEGIGFLKYNDSTGVIPLKINGKFNCIIREP